jgi:hypothetical protein
MALMKEADALKLQQELEKICDAKKVWMVVTHERRPDLKAIKVEVSIKIEQ